MTDAAGLARALHERLSALWGRPVRVAEPTRLSGGASRETWAVHADTGDRPRELVLRRATGSVRAVSLAVEAAAIGAAGRAGVPGPAVHDVGRGHPQLGEYLLMDRIEGETIPRRILRDPALAAARSGLARELGRVLARLHAARPDPAVPLPRIADPVAALAERAAEHPVPPGLALGLRWLAEHPPEPGPSGLVHGDFRLGNLIVGPDGVRAVLDWELAHLGDQLADLGWLCAKVWRFGSDRPVAGVGSRAALLDGYAEVAGLRPTEDQLRWWELHGTVTWGLMCRTQAQRHLSGEEPSVEPAAIGRRACEQEFDVLLALGLAEPDPAPPSPPAAPGTGPEPHGVPSAGQLLAAVAEYLRAEVLPAGGRTGFHARVAANVVDVVGRELALGPAQAAAHRARLDGLGCADDAALSAAIGSGALDGRWDELVAAVRAAVRERLLVANPRHLGAPA